MLQRLALQSETPVADIVPAIDAGRVTLSLVVKGREVLYLDSATIAAVKSGRSPIDFRDAHTQRVWRYVQIRSLEYMQFECDAPNAPYRTILVSRQDWAATTLR